MLESVIFTDADIQELNDEVFILPLSFFSSFEFFLISSVFCNITIPKGKTLKNRIKNSFVMKYTNVNKNQFASGVDGKKALE